MALLRRSAERSTAEFGSAPCCSRRRATSCQPAATASSRRFGSAPAASRISTISRCPRAAARIFSEQLLHPRRVSQVGRRADVYLRLPGDQMVEDLFWRRSRIGADIAPPSKMVVAWVSSPGPLSSNASTQSIRRSGTAQSPPRATPRPSFRLRGRFRSGHLNGLPAAEPARHGYVPVPSERTHRQ